MRIRVAVYVLRGDEVLAFSQEDPAAGLQVPAGGVDAGETLDAAVRREALEEAGVRVRDVRALTVDTSPYPGTGDERVTVFFAADLDSPTPDQWDQTVGGHGEDGGMVFACRFLPVAEAVTALADHQGRHLNLLGRP